MADLRLDWCDQKAARYAVEMWHYSRSMPSSKLVRVGVWEGGRFVGRSSTAAGPTVIWRGRLGSPDSRSVNWYEWRWPQDGNIPPRSALRSASGCCGDSHPG